MSVGHGAVDAWQQEVILLNVAANPYYAPYCLRCRGLVRMRSVERHYWQCSCGARCDCRPRMTGRGRGGLP